MKKVSVIVPVYNVEDYIENCLKSLLNQTLEDIEIIVVNDGSPDNSQKIIDKYVELYPNKIKSFIKENGGQGSARNLGIENCDGEYLSFVDSDDWLDKFALEKMYNLAKSENSDIVICDMVDHYEDNSKKYYNCTKFDSVYKVTPSASNKIFRKSFVNEIRFLSKLWYEDFNFTVKLYLNNPKISIISEGLYNCNCRKLSTMNNNNSLKNLDIIVIMEDIIKYANDNNKYDKNVISYLIFDHILITTINRVNNQNTKEKKEVSKKLRYYCKYNIKDYKKQKFYKEISKNRKIIAYLNYIGLYDISKLILTIKEKI